MPRRDHPPVESERAESSVAFWTLIVRRWRGARPFMILHSRLRCRPSRNATAAGRCTGERAERLVLLEVAAFDWNCPKGITPRYTAEEVERAVEPLRARIRELETK